MKKKPVAEKIIYLNLLNYKKKMKLKFCKKVFIDLEINFKFIRK